MYKTFRDFLERVEQEGELARIREAVDPVYGVSAVTLAAYRKEGFHSPALFFERLKGYKTPVVTNLYGSYKRYAMAFDSTVDTLVPDMIARYERMVNPKKVRNGPCKENIDKGDRVDLKKFPVPVWNERDAGPYITAGNVITKDTDTGKHNVGRYRVQIGGRNKARILILPFQHIGHHYNQAREKGKKTFEVAIAIGADPALDLAAVIGIPYEWEEYAWAAGNREPPKPIEVVDGETVDLRVPANAEMVIEGEIRLDEKLETEAPFGEFTGYYSPPMENPVIHVKAITYRDNPIWEGTHHSLVGPGENNLLNDIPIHAYLFNEVKRSIPELKAIRVLFMYYTLVAQVDRKKMYPGLARKIADAIWTAKTGSNFKNIIVVDDDIDMNDTEQVIWAMSVRSQPDKNIYILSGYPGSVALDPTGRTAQAVKQYLTSKLVWDATEPDLPPHVEMIKPPPGFEKAMAEYEGLVRRRR